jgi:hypothetical protein
MSTIRQTKVDAAKACPEGMELADSGGLPMGLSSAGSMAINGLGTENHIFKVGDTTEPIKNPLMAKAAPRRLDLPMASNTSSTTAASPPWVIKIQSHAGPISAECTASMASRFKSERQSAQAKSNKTVAKASAIDWLRADTRGVELKSWRMTGLNLNKQ